MANPVATGHYRKAYVASTLHQDGTPTLALVECVENVQHVNAKDEAEVNNRKGGKKYALGNRGESITLRVTQDYADTEFNLLRDAFEAGTTIALVLAKDLIATSGTESRKFDVEIFAGPDFNEDPSNVDTTEFVMRPSARSTFEPVNATTV